MGDLAIRVAGISKHYQLGADASIRRRPRHDTLSETLCRLFRRKREKAGAADSTDFWALHDVSFTIERGEAIGIIGRNGSGKSTLLKILSRITEPTGGYAEVCGRVGSLLEVGTGFHPQLTGRENIFLNGAILGMSQAEVKRKFDEIVAFSEVERFLDTPVKNYSSGMYTRLAFAVAAHLDTEILIVDEVLAVGDAEFQKKCLGKMQSVTSQEGRTVLFVSHNMAAVSQLTKRCVLLERGRVAHVGPTASAVEAYFGGQGHSSPTNFDIENVPRKFAGNMAAKLSRLRFERPLAQFGVGENFSFSASVRALRDVAEFQFNVTILTAEGIPIGNSCGEDRFSLNQGELRQIKIALPSPRLAPGRYHCCIAIGQGNPAGGWKEFDTVANTLPFEVVASNSLHGAASSWRPNWGSIAFPGLHAKLAGKSAVASPEACSP